MAAQEIPINLFVEDALSESVVRAILAQANRRFLVGVCYIAGGFGYLKERIGAFNHAARGMPYFVLTDLDRHACPPALIGDWLSAPPPCNRRPGRIRACLEGGLSRWQGPVGPRCGTG